MTLETFFQSLVYILNFYLNKGKDIDRCRRISESGIIKIEERTEGYFKKSQRQDSNISIRPKQREE